jgi:hypothetical protein
VLPVRETSKGPDGVIADGRYTEALLPDRTQMLFQLNELDLAERSPIRGTEEHEHGPFGPMTDLRVWLRPFWSVAEKAGTCWPTLGPVLMFWPYNAATGSTQIPTAVRNLFTMQAPR